MAEQPALDTIPHSFAGLQTVFVPSRAAGVDKTIQFEFSGREPGTWAMTVRDGTLSYHEGTATNPNATVSTDSDDWLKILRNELNAVSAFMGGKLKINGDMALLMQFQNWFERP